MDLEFFGTGAAFVEVIIRAVMMYIFAVALLRIFGKRTTMTTASFDLIVTVALGSILASTVVSTSRPIFEGMAALTVVVAMQWLVSLGVSRSDTVQRIVVSPARLLLQDGQIIAEHLKTERLSIEQLDQNIRQEGFSTRDGLKAVVLESSGNVSVIEQTDHNDELINKEEIGSRGL